MCTNRLYSAIKEKQDAQAIHDAAVHNNWGPPKKLRHDSEIILRLREANVELQLAMEEAKKIIEAPTESDRRVAVRIAGERDIARHLLKSLSSQGFEFTCDNDSDELPEYTSDIGAIQELLFETDNAHLYFMKRDEGPEYWVRLIYGNSPQETISNYDLECEKFLKPTFEYIKAFYDPTYIVE